LFVLQSEEISKDTEKLIDDVGTTLLSRMVVDQDPYRVKTRSLDMVLRKLSRSSLQTHTDFAEDDVGFKLPFNAITDEKAKDAQFVDTVVSMLIFLSVVVVFLGATVLFMLLLLF